MKKRFGKTPHNPLFVKTFNPNSEPYVTIEELFWTLIAQQNSALRQNGSLKGSDDYE